jgi:hypothetical protein
MRTPVAIERDDAADTVTIEGQVYTGDFFRFLKPENAGRYFELFLTDQGLAIRDLGSDPVAWLRHLGKL